MLLAVIRRIRASDAGVLGQPEGRAGGRADRQGVKVSGPGGYRVTVPCHLQTAPCRVSRHVHQLGFKHT